MPPREPAPALCACGQPVEMQYPRHATAAEYDALPENLRPTDGYAVIAVRCCGDCHPGPICTHPDTAPVPCPVCHAQPGTPCTKPDGTTRPAEHPARAATQPVAETCRHAHRETCTDPRQCQCTGGDPAPARLPRTLLPPTVHEQAAALGLPPGMIPVAAQWLHDHRIDPALVRGQIRTGFTQDNRAAMLFDYAQAGPDGKPLLDEHGHETVTLRIEPVDPPPPGSPAGSR